MKVFVTGATGFVGQEVLKNFAARARVRILVRAPDRKTSSGLVASVDRSP